MGNEITAAGTVDMEQERCRTTTDNETLIQHDDDFIRSQPQQTTFPQQLMDLIEKETVDDEAATINEQKAIEWLSGGDKFIIRDKLILENCVLPKYFNTKCKIMSFLRKLYRWGFRQVKKESPSGTMIFMHTHFHRGDKQKCRAMRSIVKKPSASASAAFVKSRGGSSSNIRQGYGGVGTTDFNMLGEANHLSLQMNSSLGMQMQMSQSNHVNSGGLDLMQRRQRYMTHMLAHPASLAVAAAATAALHANQDYSAVIQPCAGSSNSGSLLPESSIESVKLAALIIMKKDPTLNAWQALQMDRSLRLRAVRQPPSERFGWEDNALALLLKLRQGSPY